MFTWNLLCFTVCPLPFLPSWGTTEKSLALSSLHSPFRYLYTLRESPQAFFSLNSTSCPSFSSQENCSTPFIIFVALYWTFSSSSISLILESPDTVLQVWPYQCWGEGKDHLPWPTGSTPPNADHSTICLLCHKGTLLACVQFCVHQDAQGLFCKADFQLSGPLQGQEFALPCAELHEGPVSPFFQPVKVPLDGSIKHWCISHCSQFCVVSKLAADTLPHHWDL